jgi:2-hydroxymuconate-semialdehyde hydrolase
MLLGLPVAERRLKVSGISTTVLEGGVGPPLVLLHGGIECGGAYWAPVISRVVESHRVVIPDMPGLGESEPVQKLDAPGFADWFTGLLQLTCDEEPSLVSHSLLGTLAARFAVQHGHLLRRLVVYAAPGIGSYRMPLRLRALAMRFALRPSERSAERFERFALLDLERTRHRDPGWFEAFSAYLLARASVPHVKRTMRQLISLGTKQVPDSELGHIEVPTALLWGRRDRMVPLGLAEQAATKLGWPLDVIDDSAHVPHLEQPDSFLRTLKPLISSRRAAPPVVALTADRTTSTRKGS